jgi:hypothetical protein
MTYAASFQTAMRAAAVVAVSANGSATPNALFSPACFKGAVSLWPTFWGVQVAAANAGAVAAEPGAPAPGGAASAPTPPSPPLRSLRDVLQWWFFHDAAGLTVADTCDGFVCGTSCRRNDGHVRVTPYPGEVAAAKAAAKEGRGLPGARVHKQSAAARTGGAMLLVLVVTAAFGFVATRLLPPRPERLTAQARAARALAAEGMPLRPRVPMPAAADSVLSGNPTTGAARFSGF